MPTGLIPPGFPSQGAPLYQALHVITMDKPADRQAPYVHAANSCRAANMMAEAPRLQRLCPLNNSLLQYMSAMAVLCR